MEYTRKLAEFCANVTLETLPAEVIHKAKLCILDYVANIYGSLELETVRNIAAYIRSVGAPENVTALGCGFKTDVHQAAFINGTTAEAIEAQDGSRFGGNHPGVAVIPAALAVTEAVGAGGPAVIAAVVAGYEAANRPAAAMHPWHTLGGFLPTGTCGTYGAAVAAARLRGLDTDQLLNALGNAGYLLPLSMAEHLMGGYTIKVVQGGQAASTGIMAAGLAGAGVTGAPYVLEGSALNGGFAKIPTAADPTLSRITDGLGESYSVMDVYFKPYTACRHTHGAAQAALEALIAKSTTISDQVKSAEKSAEEVGSEMRGVVERSEEMRKLTDLQAQRSKSLIEIATASAARATQTVAGASEVVGITDELRQLSSSLSRQIALFRIEEEQKSN